MPTFEVKTPVGVNQIVLKKQIREAVAEATRRGKLRPNSVDSLTGDNSGNNLGPGTPIIHFEQWENDDEIEVKLILKGGGCENMNAQVLAARRVVGSRSRRSVDRRRSQVHPARGVAGAGQRMRTRSDRRLHRRRPDVGLRAREGTVVSHARRRESRSAAGGARIVDHGRSEQARDWHDGLWRPRVADRVQGRRAQPAAGELLRLRGLRLLGLSAARCRARCEDRRDQALAVSRRVEPCRAHGRSVRVPANRTRGRAAHADHRRAGARAEGR